MLIQQTNRGSVQAKESWQLPQKRQLPRIALFISMSLWLSCLLIIPGFAWAGTTLGDLAAAMQPGTWQELKSTGFGNPLLENGGSGSVLSYADKGVWNPILRKVYFMGSPHCGGVGDCQKFIVYDDTSNTWTTRSHVNDNGHGYDHNTLDPTTGIMYRRFYNSNAIWKYTDATDNWVVSSQMNLAYVQVAGGFEWFPNLYNETGGAVFAIGGFGEVHLYRKSTNTWTPLTTGLAMGSYHNFAWYSRVHKVVILGGGNGSRDLYKIDASGKLTQMKQAPLELGIHQTFGASDPVSGDYLVWGNGSLGYSYNPMTDTWTVLPNAASAPIWQNTGSPQVTGMIAIPITTYGVVMVVKYATSNLSGVYLYKHSPTSIIGDITPPSAPSGLQVK